MYSPFKLMRLSNILFKNNFADMHLLQQINKKVATLLEKKVLKYYECNSLYMHLVHLDSLDSKTKKLFFDFFKKETDLNKKFALTCTITSALTSTRSFNYGLAYFQLEKIAKHAREQGKQKFLTQLNEHDKLQLRAVYKLNDNLLEGKLFEKI